MWLLLSSLALAEIPLGATVEQAVSLDVTDDSFDVINDLAADFIPNEFIVPPIAFSDPNAISDPIFGLPLGGYSLNLDDIIVNINVDTLELAPVLGSQDEAELSLDLDIEIVVGTAATPIDIYGDFDVLGFYEDTFSCEAWVDPISIIATSSVIMKVKQGQNGPTLDATIPPLEWSWTASGSDVNVEECTVADIVNVINLIPGFNIYNSVLGIVEPEIENIMISIPGLIEPLLEDTFNGFSSAANMEIDLLGTPLAIELYPSNISSKPAGIRIDLDGGFGVPEIHECVAQFGHQGSLSTPSQLNAIGDLPANGPSHIGAYIDDDYLNQAMFAVYAGGLLCFELSDDDPESLLPISLGAVLPLLAPNTFDELLEDANVVLKTVPKNPPLIDMQGSNDINVLVDELGLDMFTEFEGRQIRFLAIDMDIDAGVDLDFDGATGEFAVTLDLLGEEAIVSTVTYNEYAPEASAGIEVAFTGVIDSIAGPLIETLLADLTFPLPSVEGLGLTGAVIKPAGSAGDRMGVYAGIGPVAYENAGGCADSGCSGQGCSSTSPLPLWIAFFIPFLARRRR